MIRNICPAHLASVILGILILSSCSTFELPREEGVLLFKDDFGSPSSGWVRFHDDMYSSDYVDGAYRIEVKQKNFEAWSVPGLEFSDVIIDVEVKKIAGPDNNVFGVICRYNKPNNFYFFLISSDGFAGIGVYHDGERALLSGENMLPANSINTGASSNNLHVECIGEDLLLFVNDVKVYEVKSTELQSGDVGVIAGTYETSGVEIEFDDFSVKNP